MTRRTKVILAVALVFFMFCVCCGGGGILTFWSFSRGMVLDPSDAKALGESMADYTLPTGYSEAFGMQLMGVEMVAIAGDLTSPDDMLIMLMKIPDTENVDQAFLVDWMEMTMQRQSSMQRLDLTLDTVETRTINDKNVELTFRKGENGAGIPYRQMSGLLGSNSGSLLIMVQGAEAGWDQDAIDSLLNSIK